MAKDLFEVHITCEKHDSDIVSVISNMNPNWKYSCIDGDPVLGKKLFCYLTTYFNDYETAEKETRNMVGICRSNGAPPVRMKIEQIVFDERY